MGLLHIYCGDGKGKTTAAVGLALRMAGAGKQVIFAQFFKNGGSSEIAPLGRCGGIRTMHCRTVPGRFSRMSEEERAAARADYSRFLEEVLAAAEGADLLVLDEAISACNTGTIPEVRVCDFLRARPEQLEVVLTGRDPSGTLLELADYVTEMKKIKHPYDRGVKARHGVEF